VGAKVEAVLPLLFFRPVEADEVVILEGAYVSNLLLRLVLPTFILVTFRSMRHLGTPSEQIMSFDAEFIADSVPVTSANWLMHEQSTLTISPAFTGQKPCVQGRYSSFQESPSVLTTVKGPTRETSEACLGTLTMQAVVHEEVEGDMGARSAV